MSDWKYAQRDASEKLARLHFYSVHSRGVEFRITIHEYAAVETGAMSFFAVADKQTNQRTAPFTPCGWGSTLMTALSECIRNIHRFPTEEEAARGAGA